MSKIWPHFTKKYPCPACGHFDWTCRAGETRFVCMRIQSDHPARDGGFYHSYGEKKPTYIPPKQSVVKVVDFETMSDWLEISYSEQWLNVFSCGIGVSKESLKYLKVGWSSESQSWAIPMRDGDNKIIGIHLRCSDGTKKAVISSRNGLFIPQCENQNIAYLCEGASNTSALLTMGFFAIGRPSCNSGCEMLKVCLKRLGINCVVIVADNDCIKVNGTRPGQDGAKKLKKELGLMSVIFTAPSPLKDVRDLLIKLGRDDARQFIQSSVSQKIWTRI